MSDTTFYESVACLLVRKSANTESPQVGK